MNKKTALSLFVISLILFSCKTTKEKVEKKRIKDGPGKIFWDDGSIKGKGTFKNYQKVNKWILFHKGTEKKLAEGQYINDKQDGKWTFTHKNGQIQMTGIFFNGQKRGIWKSYWDNGKLHSKANYIIRTISGMKIGGIEGQKISYYKSGKVWKEEEYRRGVKRGRSQEYYENGQPKEISWFNNNKHSGKMNKWWKNGKPSEQGSYINDKRTGMWKLFHKNGNKYMVGGYVDGKMQGTWKIFSPKGWLESTGSFTKGKQSGIWTYYNKKHQITKKLTIDSGMVVGKCWIYKNNKLTGKGEMNGLSKKPKKNGKWKEYYPNGKVKFEGVFMMDKKNGKFKEYYKNQKIQAEGEYLFDKKNGEWKFYNKKGSLDEQKTGRYMNDKKMKF